MKLTVVSIDCLSYLIQPNEQFSGKWQLFYHSIYLYIYLYINIYVYIYIYIYIYVYIYREREALKVLIYSLLSLFGGVFSIPSISLKRTASQSFYLHGFCRVALLKLSGNFQRDIFAKYFLTSRRPPIYRLQLY